MARIFRHPDVEDYFHLLDLQEEPEALARKATALYESGRVIVLKDHRIDFDAGVLSGVRFDEQATKKFKSIAFLKHFRPLAAHEEPAEPYRELLATAFRGDRRRMNAFAQQVGSINAQVDALLKRLFPGYRIERPSITWRLHETINENLHVDVYNEDQPMHHVRLFVNLDTAPRIWHTSHSLEHLLRNSLHLLDDEFVRTATPGRICHALNFAVFKGFEEAGREGQPKHIVFFEPGEVWAVDSRKVSHQIFFGRTALSTEHAIAESSMADPASHYYRLVERYRSQWLAASPA